MLVPTAFVRSQCCSDYIGDCLIQKSLYVFLLRYQPGDVFMVLPGTPDTIVALRLGLVKRRIVLEINPTPYAHAIAAL